MKKRRLRSLNFQNHNMVMKLRSVGLGILFLFFCSCGNHSIKDQYSQLVCEWIGKEILFPGDVKFSTEENKNGENIFLCDASYKIVSYVDSKGCISCHLRLPAVA